jgi:hypothetical protein
MSNVGALNMWLMDCRKKLVFVTLLCRRHLAFDWGIQTVRAKAFLVAMLFWANASWADTTSHEVAAKHLYRVIFSIDKPRLVQAFSSSLGLGYSSTDREVVIGVLESNEFESIYTRNLVKTFSEAELVALAEMMDSTTYRIWADRLPLFMQSLMPEIMTYGNRAIPDAQRRAAEKRKSSTGADQ